MQFAHFFAQRLQLPLFTAVCILVFLMPARDAESGTHSFLINPLTEVFGSAYNETLAEAIEQTSQNITQGKHPFAYESTLVTTQGQRPEAAFGIVLLLLASIAHIALPMALTINSVSLTILFLNVLVGKRYFTNIAKLYGATDNLMQYRTTLAAILFGLSPFVLAHLGGSYALLPVFGFPILLYAIAQLQESLRGEIQLSNKHISLIGYGLFLTALSSFAYLPLAITCTAIALLFLVPKRIVALKKAVSSIATNAKKIAIIALQYALYSFVLLLLCYEWLYSTPTESAIVMTYVSPTFVDMLIPNGYLGAFWEILNTSPITMENTSSIGISGIIVALWFLTYSRNTKKKVCLVITIAVSILLMSGAFYLDTIMNTGYFILCIHLCIAAIVSTEQIFSKHILQYILLIVILERFVSTAIVSTAIG